MSRVAIFLLVVVMATAFYQVHRQYDLRLTFTELERAKSEAQRLAAEHDRLQVNKRAQATSLRVEKLAREQLGMQAIRPGITEYVLVAADQDLEGVQP